MKNTKPLFAILILTFGVLLQLAVAAPVDGWYVNNSNNGTLVSTPPGAFHYVLGPGGNKVLADVGPYTLMVGSSLTFSGTVTNNVSTLLWNGIQFRWGILDSNGNPFHGIAGTGGDYTNYLGYWAGNPDGNSHPVYELTNSSLIWWTVSGVAKLGASVPATGSSGGSAPLGVYPFSITYQRLSTNQLLITADLNNSQAGVYSYHVIAIDPSPRTWTFDRVGMYFNPGVNSTGTLGFGNLAITLSNSPPLVLVASDFDDAVAGSDGWTGINTKGNAETVVYNPTNGLYLGCLSWSEPAPNGAGTYYVAPPKFLGDQRAAYNGTLTYSLRWAGNGTTQLSPTDVILGTTNLELGFQYSEIRAEGSWLRLEIPLNENSGWTNITAQRAATRDEMLATLTSLKRLWIRGEYTSWADGSDLDLVALLGQPSGPLQPVLTMKVASEIWINGAVGRTYRLEFKNELGPTNVWQQLVTLVLPTSPYRFIDPAATGVSRRFYRVVLEP